MNNQTDKQMINQRLIDGPCALVFKAWTDADHIMKWWGPRGFTTTTKEIEIREGGVWRYTMHGPDGTNYPNRIMFKKIVPNISISYDHDNDNDDDSFAFESEITFTDKGKQTLVTITSIFKNKETHDFAIAHGAKEGGLQFLQRFEEHVLCLNGFQITREFDCSPTALFALWTQLDHLLQWMGPKGSEMDILSGKIEVGESVHYKMKHPEGPMLYGKITYLELSPPHRIQYIQQFTNEYGEPTSPPFDETWPISMKTTVALEPIGKRTKLSLVWTTVDATDEEQNTFDSNKDGMKMGWNSSFDVLEAYIKSTV